MADLTYSNKIVTDIDAIPNAEKGAANGVATLDGNSKIPAAQLPNSVMDYLGTHDVATNTPTLVDGTGNAGDTYRISVAGTRDYGSGNQTFNIGDLIIYSGTIWERSPLGLPSLIALDDLSDVQNASTASSPDEVLKYNGVDNFEPAVLNGDNLTHDQGDAAPGDWQTYSPGNSVSQHLDELAGRTRSLETTVVFGGDNTTALFHTQADPTNWTVADTSTLKAHLDELGSRTKDLEDTTGTLALDGSGRVTNIVKDGTTQTLLDIKTIIGPAGRAFEVILFVSHNTGTEVVKLLGGQDGLAGTGPYFMAVDTVGQGVLNWTFNISATGIISVDTDNDASSATQISYRVTGLDDNTGL